MIHSLYVLCLILFYYMKYISNTFAMMCEKMCDKWFFRSALLSAIAICYTHIKTSSSKNRNPLRHKKKHIYSYGFKWPSSGAIRRSALCLLCVRCAWADDALDVLRTPFLSSESQPVAAICPYWRNHFELWFKYIRFYM